MEKLRYITLSWADSPSGEFGLDRSIDYWSGNRIIFRASCCAALNSQLPEVGWILGRCSRNSEQFVVGDPLRHSRDKKPPPPLSIMDWLEFQRQHPMFLPINLVQDWVKCVKAQAPEVFLNETKHYCMRSHLKTIHIWIQWTWTWIHDEMSVFRQTQGIKVTPLFAQITQITTATSSKAHLPQRDDMQPEPREKR